MYDPHRSIIAVRLNEAMLKERGYDERKDLFDLGEAGDCCQRRAWLRWRWARSFVDTSGVGLRRAHTDAMGAQRLLEELEKDGILFWERDIEFEDAMFTATIPALVRDVPEKSVAPNKNRDNQYILIAEMVSGDVWRYLARSGLEKTLESVWYRLQMYMGLREIGKALYVAQCKKTGRLFAERMRFMKSEYDELWEIVDGLVSSHIPPRRISNNPRYITCTKCPARSLCHGKKKPAVNCRTCKNVIFDKNGLWKCRLNMSVLSPEKQRLGCGEYNTIEWG